MKKGILIVIMGVSGAGKSSIGAELSKKTGFPFYDGDDFHPPANLKKMKAGVPLNDVDRKPWLEAINTFAKAQIVNGSVIIACSALKKSYRTILNDGLEMTLVYLEGTVSLIQERIMKRKGHFMPSDLLQSQFDTLEEPEEGIIVDIKGSVSEISDQIMNHRLFNL